MLNKIKAFIRLSQNNEKKQRVEDAATTMLKHLYSRKFNDLEMAKVMEIANVKFEQQLSRKKEIKMQDALEAEKAHDIMRIVNLKYN